MNRALLLNAGDNVAVALADLKAGETVTLSRREIHLRENIKAGHKLARTNLPAGSQVIKYGFPIGITSQPVQAGQWVHSHNLHSGLGEIQEYHHQPLPPAGAKSAPEDLPVGDPLTFNGYRRPDGQVGVRNELWIIPTVGCVNQLAENLVRAASRELGIGKENLARTAGREMGKGQEKPDLAATKANGGTGSLDGIYALKHPYGCSQLGDDHRNTQRLLAALCRHPNAGGVLVLGLGCENNNIPALRQVLGEVDPGRVKFLVAQEVEDEMSEGLRLLKELAEQAAASEREPCSIAELKLGLKCGGSDAFSGITANPLAGMVADRVTAGGGTAVLTEVPEMFGAETILMDRAVDEGVFQKIVNLINTWKQYYLDHGQPVYENPSPGNKEGGITTLEEKSLGCVQKGGAAPVVDVLAYGERCREKGLNLLSAPGNDLVSSTALAAAGCQIILFTTGRGTPLGTCVPTLKIASNTAIYAKKPHWFDFNAGRILEGVSMADLAGELLERVLQVASGRMTKAEGLGSREIAIFKSGVTL
ncbi:UxaA family hydrolase [Moorella sp. Hama-1]|uniref:UxaA family hydrolase n=1 Tax=Moorella sp. Hama-1 TaxID=2138101 RepID=UPI000D6474A5|nr:altronate dehydratase family protein [Moorella sp. Hama-1]BCV22312.1 altronate hydrolase [Moorella sp. Hama-1]